MKIADNCVLIKNSFEDLLMIYDRLTHTRYNINETMCDLLMDIHRNDYDYNIAITYYDKEIIDNLVDLCVLTNTANMNLYNIKEIQNYNTARLFVELTNTCNLNCKHCYGNFGGKNNTFISFSNLLRIIDMAKQNGIYEFDLTGGEPLLYPKLEALLSELYDAGMLVTIFTNLTLLTPHKINILKKYGVKKIITSLDSSKSEIHDAFRGKIGSFNKTLAGIKLIKESGIEISINTMVGKHNIDHLDEVIDFINKLNVKCVLDVISPEGRATDLDENIFEVTEVVSRLYTRYNTVVSHRGIDISCGIGNRFVYIKSNGGIYICPSLIDDKYKLGTIDDFDPIVIWKNMTERYGQFSCEQKSVNCDNCSGGCRARALKLHNNICAKDDFYCNLIKVNHV